MAVISTIVCSIFGFLCAVAVWVAGGTLMSCILGYFCAGFALYALLMIGSRYLGGDGTVCLEHEIAADLLALRQRDGDASCYIGKPSS